MRRRECVSGHDEGAGRRLFTGRGSRLGIADERRVAGRRQAFRLSTEAPATAASQSQACCEENGPEEEEPKGAQEEEVKQGTPAPELVAAESRVAFNKQRWSRVIC